MAWTGFALPFRRTFVSSNSRSDLRYGLLISIQSDSGIEGVGEASPVGVGSYREIVDLSSEIKPAAERLLGKGIVSAKEELRNQNLLPWLNLGLETALLDLESKEKNLPLVKLLGGVSCSLPVNALIASETTTTAVMESEEAVAQGFKTLKLKVGFGSLEEDVDLVAGVRAAVGKNIRIRLDANGSWDVAQAIRIIEDLSKFDLEFVEQPVSPKDIEGLAEVRRAVSVPIAADESIGSVHDLHKLLEAQSADLFVIKAARIGGLHKALEIATVVQESGSSVIFTSSLESSVGLAANLHLALAFKTQHFSHGLSTGLLFQEYLTKTPVIPEQGTLYAPSQIGLGVAVDSDLLAMHGIGIKGLIGSLTALN